ncbi:antirepressor protein [Streptococcus phage Javan249]|uniref:BRO-N domain-containing protein n=1 Tax=Streptococcus halotolerans TaxID=1814128 RepID=UPI0007876AAA|nr:BRO family protein [Streptococcus halotolerans]QBX16373.1 antirepressor protein [Streptococcus phage Javan249]
MKIENWNGYEIRFVDKNGEWWAILADIAEALELKPKRVKERLDDEVVSTDHVFDILGRKQEMLIVNEFGIYDTIFSSRKKEAKAFKKWVFETIKQLRQSVGLEGFEVFRMLDKEHQKQAMKNLQHAVSKPVRTDFIKANIIANKAVSNKFGYPKMIKKSEMTPEMLVAREPILDDTVDLMGAKDKFDLPISVSDKIYQKHT